MKRGSPGQVVFEGDGDLRAFILLVKAAFQMKSQ